MPPSIWAVIKANAYGHGIEQAVAGFSKAQGLAMLDLDEAVRCREAGWGGPILLLEGFFNPSDLDIVDRYHLSTTVHNREQLDMLARARLSRRVDIMLKLNSGMNRLGFSPAAYAAAHERAMLLQQQGTVGSVGKMTHFACADGPQGVNEQLGVFNSVTHKMPGAISVCNSAATLRFAEIAVASETQAHWVRPGICLYGASPFADAEAASFGLKPAMSLRSEIIAVQELKAGDSVGYGAIPRRALHAHRHRGPAASPTATAPRRDRHAGGGGRHPYPVGGPRVHGHADRRPGAHSGPLAWHARLALGETARPRGRGGRGRRLSSATSFLCALAPRSGRAGRLTRQSGGQELLRNLQDRWRRMVSTWKTGRSSARF